MISRWPLAVQEDRRSKTSVIADPKRAARNNRFRRLATHCSADSLAQTSAAHCLFS